MLQKVVGTGCEWKERRGVKETSDEWTAVWLAVTLNVGDEGRE
jgi:hypothetical protein